MHANPQWLGICSVPCPVNSRQRCCSTPSRAMPSHPGARNDTLTNCTCNTQEFSLHSCQPAASAPVGHVFEQPPPPPQSAMCMRPPPPAPISHVYGPLPPPTPFPLTHPPPALKGMVWLTSWRRRRLSSWFMLLSWLTLPTMDATSLPNCSSIWSAFTGVSSSTSCSRAAMMAASALQPVWCC